MDDLISRQAAIDSLMPIYKSASLRNRNVFSTARKCMSAIEELPSAQPDLDEVYAHAETEAEARFHAEIVRCKDCKNRGDDDCPMRFIEWVEYDDDGYIEHDDIIHDYTKDDGFCDRAERRTDDR